MRPLLRRTARPGVLVLAAVLLAVAAPAASGEEHGQGSVGIGLLEAPTERADDPRALVYVVDHLQPGDVIERRIELTNTTGGPVALDLYPAAAAITDAGWTPLEGRTQNGLSSWTSVTPTATTVAAGGRATGAITIAVPDDAPSGEHYAVVWAELPVAAGETVDVVHRVGIRLYLSVGDGAEPATDFTIDAIRAVIGPAGDRRLDVDVANTGGRAIDLSGEATLTGGPGGTSAGPFAAPRGPTIAPGARGVLAISVPDDLPEGRWTALVTVRSGTIEHSSRAAVSWSDPDAGSAPVPADVAPTDDLDAGTGGPGVGDLSRGIAALLAAMLILAVLAATLRAVRRARHETAAATT